MRRVFACLLAAGLTVAAGSAAAQGHGAYRHGPGLHGHHPRPHAGSVHRFRDAHRFGPRHGLRDGLHRPGRFAYPYAYGYHPRSYVIGEPRVTTVIDQREVAPEPSVPTIPTVLGIRAAPVGQPTLYVINDRPRRSPVAKGRPGPRVVDVREARARVDEDLPRVVHMRVPRDRPRWYGD